MCLPAARYVELVAAGKGQNVQRSQEIEKRQIAPVLSISLLGGFHVERGGEPITAFESNKVRALLAFLAVEAERAHQRSALAGMLWPDYSEHVARTNLRHVLRQLRQSVPDLDPTAPLLLTTQQTIQANPAGVFDLDVARFAELLAACRSCAHSSLEECSNCMARYTEAAALYRGDFLAGIILQDSDIFGEWVAVQRERLRRQALEIFFTLSDHHEKRGEYRRGRHYAWRQIELEPWREEAHRQLMRVLARSGQRTAALAQYAQCRQILSDELGVDPDPETEALYEQIKGGVWESGAGESGAGGRPAPAAAILPAARQDWGEAPSSTDFYGRQTETATLRRWLIEAQCRLIAVLGMGGMGKTSLVLKVAKEVAGELDEGSAREFIAVFWRSLLNAPPLPNLLRPLLQLLLPSGDVQLPTTLDEQLALLFAQLSERRCLLVLDNFESILEAGQAGRYRPGYEAYGQLLQRFGQGRHRSCLIITSRECPNGVEQMEDELPAVRSLPLDGLAPEAGRALLRTRGLDDEPARAARLVERYSGNPLALKLVSRTIQELFDGDTSAFLSDEAPIFDDIRTVLDQQFARLTALESELLLWLAVEREAITLAGLAQNLVQPPSRRALIEAAHSLQRRSLLEKGEGGFTLQNVVTEYLTEHLIERACEELESPSQPVTALLLNRHALIKAQAKEYVRQSQLRQIVQPIVSRLVAKLGRRGLVERLQQLCATLRALTGGRAADAPGYLGGNLLNLLLYLEVDLTGADFSHLSLWQAFLRGMVLPQLNLAGADLTGAAFTYSFGNVQSLQFRADGELLAVGTNGGMACVWQAQDGALLYAAPIQDPTYSFVCLHSDSRTAALGGPNHTIVIMDIAAGQVLHTLSGHTHPIWRLVFSPTGKWIASGDASGVVCLWAVASGELVRRLEGHTAPIPALAFAPAGDLLASGSVDGAVTLWRTPSGRQIRTFQAHEAEVAALRFVRGGAAIATSSADQTVCLWEVESGALLHRLRGHTRPIRLMEADAGGRLLASGGGDRFIAVWDTSSGQTLHRLADHGAALWQLACRSDGRRVAALDTNETIGVWDLHSGQRIEVYPIYHNGIEAIAFSPDGRLLVSGGADGTVYLWDVSVPAGATLRARLQGHTQRVQAVAFSSDGATIASGGLGGALRLWSAGDGASRILHGDQGGIMALAFSPDSRTLASAAADGSLDLWDVRTRRLRLRLRGHTSVITACAFSPDGSRIATCGMDRTVRLWDAASGAELHTLHGHTNSVQQASFCPDGRRIVSSSYDETIRLWDAADGRLMARWAAPNMAYISLDIHPDGALLAAGSHDHAVHLLELETGRLLGELPGHSRTVETIRFSPVSMGGAHLLASAGHDETIRLWAVESANGAAGVEVRAATCLATLRAPGPYAGMNIGGVTGISAAQRASLVALGAVEQEEAI